MEFIRKKKKIKMVMWGSEKLKMAHFLAKIATISSQKHSLWVEQINCISNSICIT